MKLSAQRPQLNPVAVLVGLLALSCLATVADSWFYVLHATREGAGLLALLNPIRMLRFVATPMGVLLKLAVFSPLIFVVFAYSFAGWMARCDRP